MHGFAAAKGSSTLCHLRSPAMQPPPLSVAHTCSAVGGHNTPTGQADREGRRRGRAGRAPEDGALRRLRDRVDEAHPLLVLPLGREAGRPEPVSRPEGCGGTGVGGGDAVAMRSGRSKTVKAQQAAPHRAAWACFSLIQETRSRCATAHASPPRLVDKNAGSAAHRRRQAALPLGW